MFTIALFGAGKIGEAAVALLGESPRYAIRVCDIHLERAQAVATLSSRASAHQLDLSDELSTNELLRGCDAVLSALPFSATLAVAERAVALGVHYFDLTEDVATAQIIFDRYNQASSICMPQCGLAPGFISIAGAHLMNSFDTLDSATLRVGALPIYPSNRLKYNLTWSTEGLINEYIRDGRAIADGKITSTKALEGYERFTIDGDEYEAFNTSGGLGTLAQTFEGKIRSLEYKSIRHIGHCELVKFLLHDLRFASDPATLKSVFERSIPTTAQDRVIVFAEATGTANGWLRQRTYVSTIYNRIVNHKHLSAIQLTTAASAIAVIDLCLTSVVPTNSGFLRSEDISLLDFLDNEFGSHLRDARALSGISL